MDVGPKRGAGQKRSPVGWFPRAKRESYLERKIRLIQEAQGMTGSLDETLASSRHLSRIEREKRSALAAAQEATDTRKAALVEASWCRILKAARIPYMSAALELQKAEKKAAEAFNKAAALGVVLKTNAHNLRPKALSSPRTPSRHKITASLDAAFEVDEVVAAALKSALKQVETVHDADETTKTENDVSVDKADIEETNNEVHSEEQIVTSNAEGENALTALMVERVKNLQPEQRASLASIVATRGLNALLKEESYEQELNARNWKGGLGDVLVKHVSRLEAEKAAAKQAVDKDDARREARKKTLPQTDVPDLGSILVKHVPKIEREKRLAKAEAQAPKENVVPPHAEQQAPQTTRRQPLTERQHLEVSNSAEISMEAASCCDESKGARDRDERNAGGERKVTDSGWPSFDELEPVKKMSRLEMEKQAFSGQENSMQKRRLMRHQEAANAWGGLDLGSSLKRHVSKLEADQAAWRRAAEEARNKKPGNV